MATIYNDADTPLYVKFGTDPSTTSFSVKVAARGYFEFLHTPIYTGVVTGVWGGTPTGSAHITEFG